MKLAIIYIKNLRSFLKTNIIASIVLFISIACVFLSSMYFVNALMSYKLTISEYYRLRTVKCTYNGQQSQLDFLSFPEKILAEGKKDVENVIFRYDDSEIRDSLATFILSKYDDKEIETYAPIDFTVVSYYDNEVNDERINIGQNINRDQIENSEYCIVYNKSIHTELLKKNEKIVSIPDSKNIGDIIKILDKEYRIVGIMNNFGYSIIPYTTGLKSLSLSGIDVNFRTNTTDEQKKKLTEFIRTEYPGLDVSAPPSIDQELFIKSSSRLLVLGIACFLGVFYLLYVYKYIIENNKKTLIINRMLGLSTQRSVLMILFQIFIVNTSVYIAMALLYRYVMVDLFKLFIPDPVFFIIIYLFVVLASSLIIYPFAKKTCRRIGAGGDVEI